MGLGLGLGLRLGLGLGLALGLGLGLWGWGKPWRTQIDLEQQRCGGVALDKKLYEEEA